MNKTWLAVIPVVLGAWTAAAAADPGTSGRPSRPSSRPSTWAVSQTSESIAPPLQALAPPPVTAPPPQAASNSQQQVASPELAPPPDLAAPASEEVVGSAPAAHAGGCCGAGCAAGGCAGRGWHRGRLLGWVTYCPLKSCDCRHVCACPQPPLYTYFLCYPCVEGCGATACPSDCSKGCGCGPGCWRNLFAGHRMFSLWSGQGPLGLLR